MDSNDLIYEPGSLSQRFTTRLCNPFSVNDVFLTNFTRNNVKKIPGILVNQILHQSILA